MSPETGQGFNPEETKPVCEICFSTSHTTDQCDVKREGHMLEVQRWTDVILPAMGVRADKQNDDEEGAAGYRLYEVNTGKELGELEILDEERALRVKGIKTAGGWGSMLTFHFTAPDGSSLKLAGAPQPIEDIFNHGISHLRGGGTPTSEQEAERELREDERIAKDWGLTFEQWQFMKKTRNGLLHEAGSMSGGKSQDFFNLMDRWQGRFSATNEKKDTLYMSDGDLEDRVFNQNMSLEEKALFMEKFGADLPEYKRIAALVAENELKNEAAQRGVSMDDWRFIQEIDRDIDRLSATLDFNGRFLCGEVTTGWRLRGSEDPKNLSAEQKLLPALNEEQGDRFEDIKTKAARYHEIWKTIDSRKKNQ